MVAEISRVESSTVLMTEKLGPTWVTRPTTSPLSVMAHMFSAMPESEPRLMVKVLDQSVELQPMM